MRWDLLHACMIVQARPVLSRNQRNQVSDHAFYGVDTQSKSTFCCLSLCLFYILVIVKLITSCTTTMRLHIHMPTLLQGRPRQSGFLDLRFWIDKSNQAYLHNGFLIFRKDQFICHNKIFQIFLPSRKQQYSEKFIMFDHNQLFFAYANISNPVKVYVMKICAFRQKNNKQLILAKK